MSDRRIPISLKVPEDEFYYEFVEPKRANKELSPFIYQILRAYFEDEAVKEAVKPHLMTQKDNRIEFINRELERIAMEHSQTIMETQALQDEIENKQADLLNKVENMNNSDEDVVSNQSDNSTVKEQLLLEAQKAVQQSIEDNAFEGRLKAVEDNVNTMKESIQGMTAQFASLMSMMKQTVGNTVADNSSAEQKEESSIPVPPVLETPEGLKKQTVTEEVPKPSFSDDIETEEKENKVEESENTSGGIKVKSAAFGALLGSMKKE